MPTTYTAAEPDVNDLLAEVMKRYHRPLHEAGVRVGVLMASEVKAHGYTAYAAIKIVPLKDRLTKQYDVELLIDQEEWDAMRDRHRRALLDHELSHIQLASVRGVGRDIAAGIAFSRDDLGRPKLKTVKGDWNGGDGFREVVKRHRDFAVEFLNAKRCHTFAVAARDNVEPETQKAIDNLDQLDGTTIKVGGLTGTIKVHQSTITEPEGERH